MRSSRRLRWASVPVSIVLVAVLAGCTHEQLRGWLPGDENGITNHTDRVVGLWTTSWIVLLIVGVITWGLIIFAVVAYRRRKGQTGLPAQMRYNMPIEIFYTVVPLILVLGFFAFTARDQAAIEEPYAEPDVQIEVIGKRWAWDFNYLDANGEPDVYESSQQVSRDTPTGEIDESTIPTLVLPVNQKVEITIESRDVAHSFWIVDFLYKKDMIPGKSNHLYFEPLKEGNYSGKCAELCGQYHSLMLFNVNVVSQAEYEDYLDSLRDAGQTGSVGLEYNPNQNLPGTESARTEH